MNKKINYLARSYDDIKNELLKFSKKYYPEISDNFNDASVGAWIIDLVSAVGDDLSYHTDRMYQETNINTANLKSSILNFARLNNVKIPGSKASMCEIEVSCVLPVDSTNISLPDWNYAPLIKQGSTVGNNKYTFEIVEDINFAEQFNKDAISNRKFSPNRDANGSITSYTITKTSLAISGKSKIYKKVLSDEDISPFMEIILPEQNTMNVESILFKESLDYSTEPNLYEFYIDEEIFKLKNQDIATYRYFEVNSLAEQYRFGSEMNYNEDETIIQDETNPELYDDYSEGQRISRYFKGKWKPITQKFMTEFTDNGFLKIIFGGSTTAQIIPDNMSKYNEYILSKIVNNEMLGVLPKAGWTMYVLYRTDGGLKSNLAQGAINMFLSPQITFTSLTVNDSTDTTIVQNRNAVITSLSVINLTPSIAGKDAPNTNEIKYLTKYSIPSQNRCVTLKDYASKIMSMPPKYGCPFRCSIKENNNKVIISTLYANENGKLSNALPQTLVENMIEYLSHYKNLGDYIEINSGKIYNIGFEIDLFIDKNYIASEVVKTVINTIKDYMDVNKHDMGEDIFIGDLEKEINNIDGVISIIELRIYSLYSAQQGNYSNDICPLPKWGEYDENGNLITEEFTALKNDGESFRIGLNEIDNVLTSDYNSMFEILNPETDICVRVKLK